MDFTIYLFFWAFGPLKAKVLGRLIDHPGYY